MKIPRANFTAYDTVKVKIMCFIYGCYELEPGLKSQDVKAGVEVFFSKLHPSKNKNLRVGSDIATKNPIFGSE
jgi:hypothetical protein